MPEGDTCGSFRAVDFTPDKNTTMSTYARTGIHSHDRTDGRTRLGREQKRLRAKWAAALKAKEQAAIARATGNQ